MIRILAAALSAALAVMPARAQTAGMGLGAAYVAREVQEPSGERLTGPAAVGQLSLRAWKTALDARYLRGWLRPDSGPTLDLVQGQAVVSAFPVPWAYLGAGPLVRTYSTGGPVERWVAWQGHVGFTAGMLGSVVRGYLELSRTLAGSVNLPARFDPGQGFEAGVVARLSPLWARLGYRVDHGGAGGGARVDTTELLFLSIGIGPP